MGLGLELALDLIEPFEMRRQKPSAEAVAHHQAPLAVRQPRRGRLRDIQILAFFGTIAGTVELSAARP
jgi:hypothetical protein